VDLLYNISNIRVIFLQKHPISIPVWSKYYFWPNPSPTADLRLKINQKSIGLFNIASSVWF